MRSSHCPSIPLPARLSKGRRTASFCGPTCSDARPRCRLRHGLSRSGRCSGHCRPSVDPVRRPYVTPDWAVCSRRRERVPSCCIPTSSGASARRMRRSPGSVRNWGLRLREGRDGWRSRWTPTHLVPGDVRTAVAGLRGTPRPEVNVGTNPYITAEAPPPPARAYTLTLRNSGQKFRVDPDDLPTREDGYPGSVLGTLLANDVEIDHSCGGVVRARPATSTSMRVSSPPRRPSTRKKTCWTSPRRCARTLVLRASSCRMVRSTSKSSCRRGIATKSPRITDVWSAHGRGRCQSGHRAGARPAVRCTRRHRGRHLPVLIGGPRGCGRRGGERRGCHGALRSGSARRGPWSASHRSARVQCRCIEPRDPG